MSTEESPEGHTYDGELLSILVHGAERAQHTDGNHRQEPLKGVHFNPSSAAGYSRKNANGGW
ncbi:hypothetical protein ColTof4_06881 [Colletotrichum tofieldiae]|nr:hypothetical protein ColTof3_11828 [Colletotrichum tofieldiae]GKT74458.1 hypothetical protein ColTof4_06881 [Colletotrichum tofieldiae]